MHLFVYCFTWLHVCTDSGLSFIVSLLLLSAVQCSHSLMIIYYLPLSLLSKVVVAAKPAYEASTFSHWIVSHCVVVCYVCCSMFSHTFPSSLSAFPPLLLSRVAVATKSALGDSTCSLWIVSHHVVASFVFCSLFSSTLPCSPSTLLSLFLSGVTVTVKPSRYRQRHLCLFWSM